MTGSSPDTDAGCLDLMKGQILESVRIPRAGALFNILMLNSFRCGMQERVRVADFDDAAAHDDGAMLSENAQ